MGVGLGRRIGAALIIIKQSPAADAVNYFFGDSFSSCADGFEADRVGMPREHLSGLPDKLRTCFTKYVEDGPICKVSPACGRETAVEGNPEAGSSSVAKKKITCGAVRRHGVAA
jgi:hypothetical protein